MADPRFCRQVVAVASAFAVAGWPASAQDLDRYERYRQTPAILAHYPDVPLKLEAPSLAAARQSFTSQQELDDFLAVLARRSPRVVAGSLGKSQQGRDIPYLVATAEGFSEPAAIRALGRPIVWLVGLQHGNEPAGGEATLAVASALAGGELSSLLDRVTVVVVPRANPDGAAEFRRDTANGLDLNRDHLLVLLPETQGLHRLMNAIPPDVVLDAHEFTVANRWLTKFGALQAVDALLLSATHPMVSAEVTRLADTLFRPRIEAALAAYGLSTHDYYTTTLDPADKDVSMGGNAPGSARNAFGLRHAVSFLIETRGVGLDMQSFQRRVATHYLAAKSVLETAAAQAGELRAATEASRRLVDPRPLVVAHRLAARPVVLPLVDPTTGARKPTPATFRDSRAVTPTVTRSRAAGYLLPELGEGALTTLRLNGIVVCRVAAAAEVDVESYAVVERPRKVEREAINPDQFVKVELVRKRIAVAAGTAFVPTAQPAGTLAALALEPDSPGSLVGVGLVPVPDDARDISVFRVAAPQAVALAAIDAVDRAVCIR